MKLPKTQKTQTAIALVAALSLASISAASAANMPNASAATRMARPASDALSLSGPQRHTAWNDLYVNTLSQKTPSGFDATPARWCRTA
jgi:hypothetical protein